MCIYMYARVISRTERADKLFIRIVIHTLQKPQIVFFFCAYSLVSPPPFAAFYRSLARDTKFENVFVTLSFFFSLTLAFSHSHSSCQLTTRIPQYKMIYRNERNYESLISLTNGRGPRRKIFT